MGATTIQIEEVKRNLNKLVRYTNKSHGIDGIFLFTGCTLRKDEDYYYDAEIKSMKANSIMNVSLEDIEVIE